MTHIRITFTLCPVIVSGGAEDEDDDSRKNGQSIRSQGLSRRPTQVNFSFPEENQLGDVNEGNTDVYGEDGDPKIPKPGGAGCCFVEDPDNFDCMVTFWL